MVASLLLLATAALGVHASHSQDGITVPAEDDACAHPPYKMRIFSSSPLIIYIQGFMTAQEREHFQTVTAKRFRRSATSGSDGAEYSTSRTSQSTDVPRDKIVRCVEQRALEFQGFDAQETKLEPLQLVKYGPGEQYGFHTDWLSDPQYYATYNGGNRLSSFFVYVHVSANTTGGGTNFPLVDPPEGEGWCGLVECDEPYANGVTFRPIEGNAIFWENLTPSGAGDARTEHAGLPVTTGDKVGMNIWTRQIPLSPEARREDVPLDF